MPPLRRTAGGANGRTEKPPQRSAGSRRHIQGEMGCGEREGRREGQSGGREEGRSQLYSPKTRHHAAKQEHAVALHEGGEEGEEAVDGHGYEEALLAAHLVRQAAPEEGAEHHPQVHNAAWGAQRETSGAVSDPG